MKKNIKSLISLLALLVTSSAFGQVSFNYLGERWTEYQQRSVNDLTSLNQNHFRDTVKVEEMKEAFFKNKDMLFHKSPYEGYDSVVWNPFGENLMLVSPLKRHPQKKIRECRGVWSWTGRYKLIELRDKDGVPQKQLLETINKDKKWLDGEILKLSAPRWYMGFIVSPRPLWDIYDKGRLVVRVGYSSYDDPDFFSYAEHTSTVIDGSWYSRVAHGAKLLGAIHGMQSTANLGNPERTFSVLLYEMPKARLSKLAKYSLELLQPENPDKETLVLFQNLKSFVEQIPSGAFKPYYTADYRIMTGRYYRVTVNKCGWLIEDYLDIK